MQDSANELPPTAPVGEAAQGPAASGRAGTADASDDAQPVRPMDGDAAPTPSEPPMVAQAQPAAYAINPPHELLAVDEEVNAKLAAAGFSQAQAQLVYDLAAERLLPLLQETLSEIKAEQELARLHQHFGGADAWRETARQLKSWAAANLTDEVRATLTASYDGVLALHQMMRASEPALLEIGEDPSAQIDEAALGEMVRDPRYWRRRDPEFIARVTAGFRRLFGD